MLKKITFLLLLLVCVANAQEKKYQSLLWEISGDGLQKKSYIYGSMHVSEKISYHLSDAFFEHLMQADMVANESEPTTWSDLYSIFNGFYGQYYRQNKFYANFYIEPIEKVDLYPMFRGTNYNLIGLLSRTNEGLKDYQEDTYLDMFIYRTGRKYGKKTVGLEDVKNSTINIMRAEAKIDRKDVEENRIKLMKLLKNKSYNEAMMDYYREKDLDMLDSLSVLSSPENFLKAMLYDRNIVMVRSMDSLMKKGSLFSAIGAAHLPGTKGVIELLRAKGYTVSAVHSPYTEKGKATKKQIESYFIAPKLETKTSADGMITLPLFPVVLENQNGYESPDLANGGFINVKRKLLNDFILKKGKQPFNHATLDSLFYENIPGDILEKKVYNEKNYLVYDIKNISKTKNAQHYRYYITPLEIIAVIMGGEGDYVRQYEDKIFNAISIKSETNSNVKFVPKKGGFQVTLPNYYVSRGDNDIEKVGEDILLSAYQPEEKANYFLLEKTLNSEEFEDSEFELKRIPYEFLNQFDIDTTQTNWKKTNTTFTATANGKNIRLLTTLKGVKYYMLGTVNASEKNTENYFQSFSLQDYKYTSENTVYKDSTAMFSIEIPKKSNEYLDFVPEREYNGYSKKKNHFENKRKDFAFTSASGKTVSLEFYNYHRYASEKSIDSLWADFEKSIKKDYKNQAATYLDSVDLEYIDDVAIPFASDETANKEEKTEYYISKWEKNLKIDPKNKIEIKDKKITFHTEDQTHQMEGLAVQENCHQAIKFKAFLKNGNSYLMQTMVEKDYQNNDEFIEKTFSSFRLNDSITEFDLFANKLDAFIEDANSTHDSIRYSALQSIENLEIDEKNAEKLKQFLATFSFAPEELDAQKELFSKFSKIKTPETIKYLENQYKKEHINTAVQFTILQSLSAQKSKEAYQTILNLLEYDLPLSQNESQVNYLFRSFEADLENSGLLFPDVFQFYSITEYQKPIINYTNAILKSEKTSAKKIKTYKKMLFTNAKLAHKRVLSWKENKDANENQYGYYNNEPTEELIQYLRILYPNKNEKDGLLLFEKVKKLDLSSTNIAIAELQLEYDKNIDTATLNELLQNNKTKFRGLLLLHHTKKEEQLRQHSNEEIATAAIHYFQELEPKKDSLTFLESRKTEYKGKEIQYYFYKLIDIDEDAYSKNTDKLTGIAFVMENGKVNPQIFKTLNTKTFLEDSEIEDFIKEAIDKSLNANHKRASFVRKKSNYNEMMGMGYDAYEDYED